MNPESAPVQQSAPQPLPQASQNQSTVVGVPSSSSSKKPFIIILIIILLLAIGAFYFFMIKQENSTTNTKPVSQVQQPVITASPSAIPSVVNLDSSDTQLDKDIQAINNKANNLATDVNNVNTGLNDKPIDNGL